MKKQEQTGRSMIEILAVLAIIGVLSIGGLAGYSLSAQRIQINNIMDIATKFSAKGVGGRTFNSLAAAGLEKPNGIDMVLDEAGNVCLKNFPRSTPKEQRMFAAFKAQASSYIVPTDSFALPGHTCNVVLSFSRKID